MNFKTFTNELINPISDSADDDLPGLSAETHCVVCRRPHGLRENITKMNYTL